MRSALARAKPALAAGKDAEGLGFLCAGDLGAGLGVAIGPSHHHDGIFCGFLADAGEKGENVMLALGHFLNPQ